MTRRLFSIGATVAAVVLVGAFVIAQDGAPVDQAGAQAAVQGQAALPPGPPGRGRGFGPGRGLGQQGQALGPGQQRGMRGRRGAPAGRGGGRGGGLAALNLTEDQRATITDLQRSARDQAGPLRDELQFTQRTLHRELFADARNDAAIAELTQKIAGLERQLADLHVQNQLAVADVLTPAQRETMRLHQGRGPNRPAGRGRGRGGAAGRGSAGRGVPGS